MPTVVDLPSSADLDSEGADLGFFGPGSVTWKVTLGPTIIPALIYTGIMFELNPPLAVIGNSSSSILADPMGRVRRTAEWTYAVMLGDTATARRAAEVVNAVHDRIVGDWPVTGREYRASDPDNLMWLLTPFIQGLLDAYAAYGVERLTPEERDQMWQEQRITAQLNRIPPEMFPGSQAEADEYFAKMRPTLALTEQSAHIIGSVYATPWTPDIIPAPLVPLVRVAAEAGTALLPDYVQGIIGEQRPAWACRATIAAYRPVLQAAARTPVLRDLPSVIAGGSSRELVREARALQSRG